MPAPGASLHAIHVTSEIDILLSLFLGAGGRRFESHRPDH
jgi:hypothetical protein